MGWLRTAYLRPRFMARKLRIQYSGAVYHVMDRGDRREVIFRDDEYRKLFIPTLAEGWKHEGHSTFRDPFLV